MGFQPELKFGTGGKDRLSIPHPPSHARDKTIKQQGRVWAYQAKACMEGGCGPIQITIQGPGKSAPIRNPEVLAETGS